MMAHRLGRSPDDTELARSPTYRRLYDEYAVLRAEREAALARAQERIEGNREWQHLLRTLGFDVTGTLTELELTQSRWHMDFARRHGGQTASVADQLVSKAYVRVQVSSWLSLSGPMGALDLLPSSSPDEPR